MRARKSPNDVAVRQAGPDDVMALVELMVEFHAEARRALDARRVHESFCRLLDGEGRGTAWMACRGEEPAGYVVLTRKHCMEAAADEAFIEDLYVRPAFRRRGVGSSLLAAFFDHCHAQRIAFVHVEVAPDNRPAAALYHAFGLMGTHRRILTLRTAGEPRRN